MNNFDPTGAAGANFNAIEHELSVEDVAQIQAAESAGAEAGAAQAIPIPPPNLTVRKRPVSGRYRSTSGVWQLELRVDVDGKRPMKRVSGDLFQVIGRTVNYFGSWIANAPTVTFTATTVTIEGVITATFSSSYPKIKLTIPRALIIQPQAAATLRFYSRNNQPGAVYTCAFESVYFRKAQYEQDWVDDVTTPVFNSYNTGSLPSGGPARALSVSTAYAEAGIEMQTSGVSGVVPVGGAGANVSWSNAELHASMLTRFSLWKEEPQWKVWLLAAQKHDLGSGLYGIMFDQAGKQRQGCATFHAGVGGTTADQLRLQLYTYVHELGHCFNLLHSWQKSYAAPPIANRPDALSWMNYPWNYPDGGPSAFWSAFPFLFDDQEVIHLRHAFRNNIIMGGNNFAVGAGLQETPAFSDPIIDNSGLRFEITSRRSFACGEPVVIELKLSATNPDGKSAHTYLHPNAGLVQIGIRKPGGQVVVYEPLIEHCMAPSATVLNVDSPTVEDSAYIGFGKGGFYFDQSGVYQIRAVYHAIDGSRVMSNILTLRVRNPLSAPEEDLADLFFGEDQGTLLYLLGSDSENLANGRKAFERVIEQYGKYPMSTYARMVMGINLGRDFKAIGNDNTVKVRPKGVEEGVKLLSTVIDSTEAGAGVDPITLDMTATCLANLQHGMGDEKGAATTLRRTKRKALRAAVR